MVKDYIHTSNGNEKERPSSGKKHKKKPSFSRLSDANKKLLASSHKLGPNCNCSRFGCFKMINLEDKIRS